MATILEVVGTRTSLTVTGLGTLASATYVASNAFTPSTNDPLDVLIEVELASTNVVASNKQSLVFLQTSLDGTNYTSGPTSGTTTTDEPDLIPLGVVPMNTSTTTHRGIFSVRAACGYIPQALKVIVKNEIGVAMTSGAVYTSEVNRTVA